MLSVGLRQIEYTLAIVKHGSVTAAAENLHVSQPALSNGISKLEDCLGAELFIRKKGSPLVLTSFGREFVNSATEIVDQIDNLVNRKGYVELRHPVTIGCFEDLGPLLVGELLAGFKQHFPTVKVTIRTGDFDWLDAELKAGRIDFAVTYDLAVDTTFYSYPISNVYPRLLIYPEHSLAKKRKIGLKLLANEPLVVVDQAHSIEHIISLFRDRGIVPNITHRAATFEIMRSIVANKMAVGISYTQSQSGVSYDGKPLLVKDISDNLPAAGIVLISQDRSTLSSTAKELANHTLRILGAAADRII